MKTDIKSMRMAALKTLLAEWGEPAFRAKQIFSWLHGKRVSDFAQMSNLSLALREKLEANCYINCTKIKKRLVSQVDGTVKYLYGLADDESVEAVLMEYRHGRSLCVSTQAGCRMGCAFCASTRGGLARGLTAGEMLDEVYIAAADCGHRVDSVVLMGIGEPLDNFESVTAFLQILSDPDGYGLSLRHVSLSTCGLVDQIYELAALGLGLTLSISLHAPNDEIRRSIMPIAVKWPLDELMKACKDYFSATGRRISYEYALIEGVNDADAHAHELVALLRGQSAHVNLIPVNEVAETGFRRSPPQTVARFMAILTAAGVNVTRRRELGTDIAAACGQLRRAQL